MAASSNATCYISPPSRALYSLLRLPSDLEGSSQASKGDENRTPQHMPFGHVFLPQQPCSSVLPLDAKGKKARSLNTQRTFLVQALKVGAAHTIDDRYLSSSITVGSMYARSIAICTSKLDFHLRTFSEFSERRTRDPKDREGATDTVIPHTLRTNR
ncbi:hypothetical protein BDN67DRAFT_83974 [Paxillus ammoniavirescens]|nr:hypothetical protein BDN67DRAFT_83974 [Paxillus ammoniavirescens]